MSSVATISVVMPVRDDAVALPAAVSSVLAQQVDMPVEVVVAVGPSTDGTEDVARRLADGHPQVTVVENPTGGTAAGLNLAIAASSADVVARVDSHAELSSGYLQRALELLEETGADNIGGVQRAVGATPFQKAVAAAMSSRFGTGDATFHYGGEPGPTDTVYLGVFRRSALERVGGFDESLVRNQDYELNIRIRQTGGVVYFHPDLEVTYRPRATLRGLARQYFEYGRWKRLVVRQHPGSIRLRQLAPPMAVLGVTGSLLGGLLHPALLLPAAGYLAALTGAGVLGGARHGVGTGVRLPLIYATMHLTWGVGFLIGPPGAATSTDARTPGTA